MLIRPWSFVTVPEKTVAMTPVRKACEHSKPWGAGVRGNRRLPSMLRTLSHPITRPMAPGMATVPASRASSTPRPASLSVLENQCPTHQTSTTLNSPRVL